MKKLLVLNFFPALFPPSSGGEQRYHHVYRHLSRDYDVTLLSPTFPEKSYEIVEFNARFREHRVPKESVHVELHLELERLRIGPECSALVCALAAGTENQYHRRYRELIANADIVVHESPFMIDYDEELGKDGKPRVYNSYNDETDLMAQMLEGPCKAQYVAFIAELEARLVRESALVLATSSVELELFKQRYGCDPDKIALAPNGFEPTTEGPVFDSAEAGSVGGLCPGDTRPLAIFLASGGHPPNIEAARYISEVVAPSSPNIRFAIAGTVCSRLEAVPANVQLVGLLSDENKRRLFRSCDVALNPIFSGAGTNLKMLDYMSCGLPVVTTPAGARGLDVESGRHCIVVSKEDFVSALSALVANPAARERLGQSARELAYARYTWGSTAERARRRLALLTETQPGYRHASSRRKILALNDFPASNAA